MERIEEILLNDFELTHDIVNQLDSLNGCLEWLVYLPNDEDFFDTFFKCPDDAVRAVCFGDYNYMDEYVRFNAYGNLESANEFQIMEDYKNYIEEITENLIEYHEEIDIYNEELKELLKELNK